MSNFFVGMDPSSPNCDGFDASVPELDTTTSTLTTSADASLGANEITASLVGCYEDSSDSRVFDAAEDVDGSDMSVQVESLFALLFFCIASVRVSCVLALLRERLCPCAAFSVSAETFCCYTESSATAVKHSTWYKLRYTRLCGQQHHSHACHRLCTMHTPWTRIPL